MTVITERVRGYELLERAGQDGPWAVHLARASATGADVLVKTLACHRVDKRALKRIVRGFAFPEALAAHDGVVPVLEVGTTGDGRPFLATPLHEGLTLAERPGRSVPMPLEQATGVLRAVARALAATHAAGGVHGRVKPENVVMTGTGVMLTGFAMSALMSIVELPDGTLPSVHASPEELEGHPPVAASDVYALASMAYELLAGRPAFALDGPGSSARFILGVLTEAPPPFPESVPQDLAALLTGALSKDPAVRPSATDLTTALSRSLTTTGPNRPIPTTLNPAPSTTGPGHPGSSRPSTTGPGHPPAATGPGQSSAPALGQPPATTGPGLGQPVAGTGPGQSPATTGPSRPSAPGLGRPLVVGGPDQPFALNEGAPATGRPPVADLGQPSRSPAVEGEGTGPERSAPRELVWTVDPDRSQVRPPAGPQPFLTPPPDLATSQPPAPGHQNAGATGGKRIPLFVAGASGLAVLIGVAAVALAMNGRPQTPQAQQRPVAATDPAPSDLAPPQALDQPQADQPQADQPNADQPNADGQPDQPQASPSADVTASPPPPRRTTDPTTLATYRPKSLKLVSDNGTTVTLSWKSVRKSDYPTVIQQAPNDRMMSAATGTTTYTIGNLNPTTGYCFKIGTVVALGRPSSVAWSSALCIRGASEAGTGGQNDEVQPPIVLPLATPPS